MIKVNSSKKDLSTESWLWLMKYRMRYHLIREIKLRDSIKREILGYSASPTRTSDP